MGIQVQLAQSPDDEAALVDQLRAKYDLVAIPRILHAPGADAVPLGTCPASRQLLCFAGDAPRLLATIHQLQDLYNEPVEGHYAVRLSAVRGLYLEWSRSRHYEPNAYSDGRFYFNTSPPVHEPTAQALRRVFAFAKRRLQRYPKRSNTHYPVYVGPDLAARVATGTARCVWAPSIVDIELIDNG